VYIDLSRLKTAVRARNSVSTSSARPVHRSLEAFDPRGSVGSRLASEGPTTRSVGPTVVRNERHKLLRSPVLLPRPFAVLDGVRDGSKDD
jgi:hypothetical protein